MSKQNDTDIRPADPRFSRVLEELEHQHRKKGNDYGADDDHFSNVRSAEDFGVPGWLGAVIRANDKVNRIKRYVDKGYMTNESLEDALLDAANYFIIALILRREKATERADYDC